MASSPLPGIHVPARAHPDPPVPALSLAAQDAGQVVLVHEVAVPRSSVLLGLACVLLLVFGEYQLGAPALLTAAPDVRLLAAGRAVRGLGDTVNVATLVPLKILLEVQREVAGRVGRAGNARERRLPAVGAELARKVLADLEAPVTPGRVSMQQV